VVLAALTPRLGWAAQVQRRQLVAVRFVVLMLLRVVVLGLVGHGISHDAVLVHPAAIHHLAVVLPGASLPLGRPLHVVAGA